MIFEEDDGKGLIDLGIFSSAGRREDTPEEAVEAAAAAGERERASAAGRVRYPRFTEDALLILTSPDGILLGRARLASYSPWNLILGRLPGETELPALGMGQRVRIQGRSESKEPFVMNALVSDASPTRAVLCRLEPVDDLGKRSAPRYPLWVAAELLFLDGKEPPDCWPCELANLSRTGACVIGAEAFATGTRLRLRTELAPGLGQISFHGKIVRSRGLPDGRREHGILLAELTREKRTRLEAELALAGEAAEAAARR